MARGWSPRSVVLHAVIVAGAAVMFFPFLWTIVTSITPGAGLTMTPSLVQSA